MDADSTVIIIIIIIIDLSQICGHARGLEAFAETQWYFELNHHISMLIWLRNWKIIIILNILAHANFSGIVCTVPEALGLNGSEPPLALLLWEEVRLLVCVERVLGAANQHPPLTWRNTSEIRAAANRNRCRRLWRANDREPSSERHSDVGQMTTRGGALGWLYNDRFVGDGIQLYSFRCTKSPHTSWPDISSLLITLTAPRYGYCSSLHRGSCLNLTTDGTDHSPRCGSMRPFEVGGMVVSIDGGAVMWI